jgi:DNA-binding transcriptional ArsR family regulator
MKRSPPAQSPHTLTELLAALAEMIRLRLLRLLEAEELSVGEVAKVVQLP